MFKKLIGSKQFYIRVLTLVIPIMVQNGITNLVNMLDNIMVGRVGTIEINGVSIANQLIFVFNLCVFGAVSGAGIFLAQYFGNKDNEGVRHTFRFKLLTVFILSAVGIAVFALFGEPLMKLYLTGEGSVADAEASLLTGKRYLGIMLIGLFPFALVQAYSSSLRETNSPNPPMIAGIVAVLVNLVLNYVLIFGHLGFPKLGVIGAAIATVIARFAELTIVVVWTHTHRERNPFAIDLYKSFRIPRMLVRDIVVKGLPLMLNETMWSAGISFLNQCYSVRGLAVLPAASISQTFFNVFSAAFLSVGSAIGILLGQKLGAGKLQEAKEDAWKLVAFSVTIGVVFSVAYFFCTDYIPDLYNTSDEVKLLASRLMKVSAIAMPIDAFANACYFTLRSGGKTLITILFDSCFVWVVSVPTAFIISRYTSIPIIPLFFICHIQNILKDILGFIFVKKGIWIKRMT